MTALLLKHCEPILSVFSSTKVIASHGAILTSRFDLRTSYEKRKEDLEKQVENISLNANHILIGTAAFDFEEPV